MAEARPSEWCCGECGRAYPLLDGVPVLLRDPESWRWGWGSALGAFSREMTESVRHLLSSAVDSGLPKLTRARLVRVAESLERHERIVLQLFRAAEILPRQGGSTESQSNSSVLDYYSLIHRDFAWSPVVDEVSPSLAAIFAVFPSERRLGRTLVLGAGTARLAWDLGLTLPGVDEVVALDINPLPFLVTSKLTRGETVQLFELPGHPRTSADASQERVLLPPSRNSSFLTLIFGDGLDPPVAEGVWDTIVTPWFVDQVPKNAADLLPVLRRLLAPSGVWINHGPLVYDPARTGPAHRYARDEFLELVSMAGFSVLQSSLERVPYMASPLSTQARVETVLTFCARSAEDAGAKAQGPQTEPAFLRDPSGTVPVARLTLPNDFAFVLPILQQVFRLIDGRRTAREIALELVEKGELADDGTALSVVSGCLRVLHRASQAGRVG